MAAIKQRKTKYSVIYWYVNEQGERKQKWDTVDTVSEAKSRKVFVEFYQERYGQVIVPNEETYFQRVADEKAKTGKEDGTDEHDSGSEPIRRRPPTPKSAVTPQKDDITFSEFLKHYVKVYGTSKWSMSTYSGKTGLIRNYIDPYIGDKKLSEITTECLSEYYNDLLSVERVPPANRKKTGECVAPSGVKKIHDVIRSALNQAMKWNYLDPMMQNPAKLATLPTMKKTKRKVWSVSTFREALPRVEDDILALAMNLAFSCSLRVGEITGLTWDCVFIDEESIENGNARILIAPRETFRSDEAFTRVLLHEMTHSTGHPSALARELDTRFGSPSYAEEELVAELGSLFLSADLGIQSTDLEGEFYENHVSYLQSWMNALENDPSYLFKAASKADHADTFIMERYEEELGKNIEIDAPELEEEVSLAGESHDMASASEHQPESEMPEPAIAAVL